MSVTALASNTPSNSIWAQLAACLVLAAFSVPATGQAFSHDDWQTVLQRFVDDRGFVDYHGLAADRETLDRYIAAIEAQSPRSHPHLFPSREEKLAYYLNAYNAQVFQGVLSRGPEEKSVWSGLISGLNFFVRMKVTVGGERMSLKHLEDKLIRDAFGDPRIHAALNCASVSCPRLPRDAFRAEGLDQQLDAAMSEFVTTPAHTTVKEGQRTVYLTEIFDFFPGDFLNYEKSQGNSRPNMIDYVNRFRPADGQIPREYKIKYFDYDKGINSQRAAQRRGL